MPSATIDQLRRRAELLEQLRRFFHAHGFWEVETPLLSHDTVIDRFLDPIPVTPPCHSHSPSNEPLTCWLQTSPEFGMKRLLAAGADAIFQITRAFRRDELGPLHNPEFTMVEWYRVGDTMQEGMQLLAELAETLLNRGPVRTRSYADVFTLHLGLNPHQATIEQLARAAQTARLDVPTSLSDQSSGDLVTDARIRDEWLHLLVAECIQPHLGQQAPEIIYHFPASQAALARVITQPEPVAERFELYASGIELANGYHELLDADTLADRQRRANAERSADGKPTLPENNRLLDAMRHGLPPCTGVALGFDRLAMIALGANRLADVLAFPFDRA